MQTHPLRGCYKLAHAAIALRQQVQLAVVVRPQSQVCAQEVACVTVLIANHLEKRLDLAADVHLKFFQFRWLAGHQLVRLKVEEPPNNDVSEYILALEGGNERALVDEAAADGHALIMIVLGYGVDEAIERRVAGEDAGRNTDTLAITGIERSLDRAPTVIGARLTDVFPVELTAATFTSSVVTGTVTGNTESGSGNVDDELNMTANSRVDYQVTVDIAPDATGNITNTVTIDPPVGIIDRNPADNTATETTSITQVTDLSIIKTSDETEFVAGEEVTYTILARNLGPDDVTGAIVEDIFPAELMDVTYTSTVTGVVSGETPSGNGNISDTVNMSVGSSIEYTVTGLLVSSAAG